MAALSHEKQEELARNLRVCWEACDLSYLLHSSQEELRAEYQAHGARRFTVVCARRWGKSFWLCVEAVEKALATPNADIKYAAPTQKEARKIMREVMRPILRDCPEDMAPRFMKAEGEYQFRNGSIITLAGCDSGNADRLRGTSCHLGILDEAGFIDDLEYVVKSVLFPQLLTTGGRMILASTPSRSPAHPFVAKYMLEAEAAGALRRRTIYDAPHVTESMLREYIAEAGGEDTSDWRREGLAEAVVDQSRAIVPEFTDERADLVVELRDEEHVDRYVVADFGYSDMTVIGFFEWRFRQAKLYQVDELVFRNKSSADIAPAVTAKERELWGTEPPMIRFGDPNAHASHGLKSRITLQDLAIEHGQAWAPVRRDHLEAGVNALRLASREHRYAIHPRCTTTIAHLAGGIWNAQRTSFAKSGEHGHFDGVAMIMYANRHIDRTHNPGPRHGNATQDTHHVPKTDERSATGKSIRDALYPKKGKR